VAGSTLVVQLVVDIAAATSVVEEEVLVVMCVADDTTHNYRVLYPYPCLYP